MRSSSTVTGSMSWPSAATTVSFRSGIRTSKTLIDEPLIKRSRTRSPFANVPVQFPAGVTPFVRYVYAYAETSARSVGCMRIAPHARRSANAALSPCERASRTKSAVVRLPRLK